MEQPSLKQLAVRGLREDGKLFTKKLLGSHLLSLRVLVTQAGSIGALRFACLLVWVAIGVVGDIPNVNSYCMGVKLTTKGCECGYRGLGFSIFP